MKTLIKGGTLINEGQTQVADILIEDEMITRIDSNIDAPGAEEISAEGLWVMPGCIDDQVHFREPGLTHKADIKHESRAAVAGGVTTYMEMPNTIPAANTLDLLERKFALAQRKSAANYSFYLGAANDNIDDILKADPGSICGIKVFMGSSTGQLLVDNPVALERIFKDAPMLVATHCEDEQTIRRNTDSLRQRYPDGQAPAWEHPEVRNRQACLLSSKLAVKLAKKHGTRLHVLHITTAEELALFPAGPIKDKQITAEVCVHHLWFTDADYEKHQHNIKCNPAIKTKADRDALRLALAEGKLDIVATDHAPHLIEEKQRLYLDAPSGLPLIQYGLPLMLDLAKEGHWTKEQVVTWMSHNVSDRYQILKRGYLREGYFADITLIDPKQSTEVQADSIESKCGWSPFEGHTFGHQVSATFVNGHLAYSNEKGIQATQAGQRLRFDRS